jgi:uncharacterized protein (DUF983 family)
MTGKSNIALGVRRGVSLRCPHCGDGRLFGRFLKVSDHCETCGEDNSRYPSDDAPPYITVVLIGHLLLPLAIWTQEGWSLNLWVTFAIWLPLMVASTVAMLPFVKGAVVGFAWATGVTRETARQ